MGTHPKILFLVGRVLTFFFFFRYKGFNLLNQFDFILITNNQPTKSYPILSMFKPCFYPTH